MKPVCSATKFISSLFNSTYKVTYALHQQDIKNLSLKCAYSEYKG